MTPGRWQQIKTILDVVEEQPPTERQALLVRVCDGDADLLAEVESLLDFEDELDGFIEDPVLAVVSRGLQELDRLAQGERVGPYRLERLLGKGGMGAVYLAFREEDFEQRVALKLLSSGPSRADDIRRFEAERQILARLEHPNIARLLDGGTSREGVPYFAMEVVEGPPIDCYCEDQGLSVKARLELFLGVCSALQSAHQSLVIHRDLKPGNILVDRAGVPKLLDFGIAKLLRPDRVPAVEATRTLQAFTLYYASPEQLKGEIIGTASDVYSLGVVIYQTLTGRLPGDLDERRSHFEMLRAICEEEPLPASLMVEPDRRRELAGDVDAILARALRKEPTQRYASIQDFAADIRSYLNHQPVLARQGDVFYRLGKLLRRHRLALASVAAILLVAGGFTVALVHQLRATERARDRAEEVSSFLIDLFQAASPDVPGSEEQTLRGLLAKGREKLEAAGLEQDKQTRATLQLKLGEVYIRLGDYAEAESLIEGAIRIWRSDGVGDRSDLAAALNNLAGVYINRGEGPRAEVLLRECIAIRRRLGQEDDLLKPLGNLATLLVERGELAEAEEIYRESLARRRTALGPRHKNVANSLRGLASVLKARGLPQEAEPLLLEALSIREEAFGKNNVQTAYVLVSLGSVYRELGQFDEAQRRLETALPILRAELGEDNLEMARAKKELGLLEIVRGRPEKGCLLLGEAVATLKSIRSVIGREIAEAEKVMASCPQA